jgi:hypothetical protein
VRIAKATPISVISSHLVFPDAFQSGMSCSSLESGLWRWPWRARDSRQGLGQTTWQN